MAESITNTSVSVTPTRVRLYEGSARLVAVTIQNRGPAEVFVGSSLVVFANGVGIPAGGSVTYTREDGAGSLLASDRYAIALSGANDVRIEQVRA